MLRALVQRFKQGHRTRTLEQLEAGLPPRLRGLPETDFSKCPGDCSGCASVCPTGALKASEKTLDMGRCVFCGDCARACPKGAVRFTKEHRLAAWAREDLVLGKPSAKRSAAPDAPRGPYALGATGSGKAPDAPWRKLYRRSLKLRQVSAGGCNACEADINVLGTLAWDLGRFGIQIVASPRHADGLIVTGPVTENMKLALEKTYKSLPSPRFVIAVGACACSGGLFAGNPEQHGGVASVLPVDMYIPGCPPHPLTILDGLLRVIGD